MCIHIHTNLLQNFRFAKKQQPHGRFLLLSHTHKKKKLSTKQGCYIHYLLGKCNSVIHSGKIK